MVRWNFFCCVSSRFRPTQVDVSSGECSQDPGQPATHTARQNLRIWIAQIRGWKSFCNKKILRFFTEFIYIFFLALLFVHFSDISLWGWRLSTLIPISSYFRKKVSVRRKPNQISWNNFIDITHNEIQMTCQNVHWERRKKFSPIDFVRKFNF